MQAHTRSINCSIHSTQDELVATEAVFRGLLAGLSPEEAVALMSALVFQVIQIVVFIVVCCLFY